MVSAIKTLEDKLKSILAFINKRKGGYSVSGLRVCDPINICEAQAIRCGEEFLYGLSRELEQSEVVIFNNEMKVIAVIRLLDIQSVRWAKIWIKTDKENNIKVHRATTLTESSLQKLVEFHEKYNNASQ